MRQKLPPPAPTWHSRGLCLHQGSGRTLNTGAEPGSWGGTTMKHPSGANCRDCQSRGGIRPLSAGSDRAQLGANGDEWALTSAPARRGSQPSLPRHGMAEQSRTAQFQPHRDPQPCAWMGRREKVPWSQAWGWGSGNTWKTHQDSSGSTGLASSPGAGVLA